MKKQNQFTRPEIWGGIECTINRISDDFKDQLTYSGHYDRPGDIERIAGIGIERIRYPVLWEKHQPKRNTVIDWSWTDRQLENIRSSQMKPIVGLMHHGSGPSFTNLLDSEFPYLLAAYAYEVASRYPWVNDYTPVNEPLTTARFSGLYGLWYPHRMDERSFYKMLINQLKGTVLAMEAIRSVNPLAGLIQTEDLGKTHSTTLLSYQATFENERRLLTFDILTGRLQPGHPQYGHILGCGITEEEILFFRDHPCETNTLGLNYYITSERWLDEDIEKYDHQTYGGNGRHFYADTEVVRANNTVRSGFKKLATEIWNRYQIPLAVTEVHLHCTREDQLRWFKEIWDDSIFLSHAGIEVKGVTAWAMLGSFDWDSLLTRTGTQYESGVFDIKANPGELHPTALAKLITQLARGRQDFHPVIAGKGWWDNRLVGIHDQSRVFIIPNGRQPDFKNLAVRIHEACNLRCIDTVITSFKFESVYSGKLPWAVINTGEPDDDLKFFCAKYKILYVGFENIDRTKYSLSIRAARQPINFHQINKMLDLMIDGATGDWIFDEGEIFYKSHQLLNRK